MIPRALAVVFALSLASCTTDRALDTANPPPPGSSVSASAASSTPAQASNSSCPRGSIDWGNSDHGTYLGVSDSGKTLCLVETTRFGIDLDETRYPFAELRVEACRIGYVSNYGPGDRYPIGYQALSGLKSCIIRNRDWWVRLVPA